MIYAARHRRSASYVALSLVSMNDEPLGRHAAA